MIRKNDAAFTLIELLVVVAIITALLALLTPALDQAIYQSELAFCSATLHGIAGGVQTYTVQHKRAYPYRAMFARKGYEWSSVVRIGTNVSFDDRPLLAQAFPLKMLECPLNQSIVDVERSDADTQLWVSYNMYFGAKVDSAGGQSMLRLGDRVGYQANQSFGVLASDYDAVTLRKESYGTHPTKSGASVQRYGQNEAVLANAKATWAGWYHGKSQRDPVDSNYAYDDGSVLRITDVRWDEGQPGVMKGRMAPLPHLSDGTNYPGDWDAVPKQ